MGYPFRDEQTGKVYELTFEQMMEADVCGALTLPSGEKLRRARDIERERTTAKKAKAIERGRPVEIISDALGFTRAQLKDFEADRVANGFRGVEFTQDPHEPTFMQVRCSSPQVLAKYMSHRDMVDKNSRNGSGASITQHDLDEAKRRVMAHHPVRS